MDPAALLAERAERDRFLKEHYASPLPEEHRAAFEGLECYPPDGAWRIPADLEECEPETVAIRSTAGTETGYSRVGIAHLLIGTSPYHLVVLDDGDGGRFIPFHDGTSGDTTYAGGRYVGIEVPEDGSAVVDFNRASNPWCVYDEEFSCPLPPPENVITERVEAGEKLWKAG